MLNQQISDSLRYFIPGVLFLTITYFYHKSLLNMKSKTKTQLFIRLILILISLYLIVMSYVNYF